MIKLMLYMLVAALVVFSTSWICDEIRMKDPYFADFEGLEYLTWMFVGISWPLTAAIAYGYLASQYFRKVKKEKR